jgi:AcrR family transcriptional regulator
VVVAKKRGLRADAERNRRHVLEVAQQVFAREGLAVPIDEIARRAGLGVGTLYRHFPTKEALFAAIVVDRIDQIAEQARAVVDAEDPVTAFFGFLEHLVAEGGKKKDFMDALGEAAIHTKMPESKALFRRALGTLLKRAQDAGGVRGDVTVVDVLALTQGVFAVAGTDARSRAKHLAIVSDGLRPRSE